MKEIYVNIGAILKSWRLSAKKTLRSSAAELGVTHTTLYGYEQGYYPATLEAVVKIQKYHKVKEKDKIVKDKALHLTE